MFVEVGSMSGVEPPRHQARLLPSSPSMARSGQRAPSPGALSCGTSVTLPVAAIKALRKDQEDVLGAIEDV
jgi:hypothetical protein